MKQQSRQNLVLAGCGILISSFSQAAQAASLGPAAPMGATVSGAAWAAAGNAALPPAAGLLLSWAPLLLLALLGAVLAILIWRQPRETGEGGAAQLPARGKPQRAGAGAVQEGAALISAIKR